MQKRPQALPPLSVRRGPTFNEDCARLRLDAKTQAALDDTIAEIRIALQENPHNPDRVRGGIPYPRDKHQTWKRRVGRPGSNMGKRGGLRLCYWWRRKEREIVLLFLYANEKKQI